LPCLVIKERDHPFGVWQLRNKEGPHAIKVTGPLSSIMEKLSISGVSMGRGLLCVPGGMLAKTLPVVI
jgi:LysR family transcriptional activator of dmlA